MVDGLRAGKRYNFSDYAAVEDSGLYKIDKKLVGWLPRKNSTRGKLWNGES